MKAKKTAAKKKAPAKKQAPVEVVESYVEIDNRKYKIEDTDKDGLYKFIDLPTSLVIEDHPELTAKPERKYGFFDFVFYMGMAAFFVAVGFGFALMYASV